MLWHLNRNKGGLPEHYWGSSLKLIVPCHAHKVQTLKKGSARVLRAEVFSHSTVSLHARVTAPHSWINLWAQYMTVWKYFFKPSKCSGQPSLYSVCSVEMQNTLGLHDMWYSLLASEMCGFSFYKYVSVKEHDNRLIHDTSSEASIVICLPE